MARSRYKIFETDYPYFTTCTVVEWLPLLRTEFAKQTILESLKYQQKEKGLKVFVYTILHNHLHLIISSENIVKNMCQFKSFTARRIIDYYQMEAEHSGAEPRNEDSNNSGYGALLRSREVLRLLSKLNPEYHTDSQHQFWQEGYCPKQIMSMEIFQQKLDYIHFNPVRKGYVQLPEEWKWFSANPNGCIILDQIID